MVIFGSGSFAKVLFLLFHKQFDNEEQFFLIENQGNRNIENVDFWSKRNINIYDSINNLNFSNFIVAIGNEFGFERLTIQEKLKEKAYQIKMHHFSSYIDQNCKISDESIIMPNVTIMPLSEISKGCIINTSATIDHEVFIDKGCHVMGSSYIAGRVKIGKWTTIGANATIFPDITIGENCFIGAGSIVNANVPNNSIVVGQPAKFLKQSRNLPSKNFVLKNNNL